MTKSIILHIGPHKTGTTTIQAWAKLNEKVLSQHNVHYPKAGRNIDGNHSELAWSISSDARSSALVFDDLLTEIEGLPDNCTILISGEEFEYLSEDAISLLRQRLVKYETRILATLRPQHEIIRSQYGEWLKQFLTIDEFSYFWRVHTRFPEYNYVDVVRKWGRHFGLGKLVLMSLKEVILKPGGLIGELCHLLKVPLAETEVSEHKNVSDSAEVFLLWRYMLQKVQLRTGMRFGIEDPTLGPAKLSALEVVRERYQNVIWATQEFYQSGSYEKTKFIGYSDQELSEIQDKFHECNEELFGIAGRKLWDRDNDGAKGTSLPSISVELMKKMDDIFIGIEDGIENHDANLENNQNA